MNPQTQPTTRRRHAARPARREASPRIPRRVSGPAAGMRAGGGGTVALPRPVTPRGGAVASRPVRRGRTGEFARLAAGSLVDRFLRGRGWICFVGVALGGIVFMQVWLLKLNTGISRAVQTTTTLERQNSELQASIARLAAGERIRRVAGGRGMVLPIAGDVGYVTVRPGFDETRALRRMQSPTQEARDLLASSRATQPTIDLGQTPATTAAATGTEPMTAAAATAPVATGLATTAAPAAPVATAPASTAAAATTAPITAAAGPAPQATTAVAPTYAATTSTAPAAPTAAGG